MTADTSGLRQRVKSLVGFRVFIAIVLMGGWAFLRPGVEEGVMHSAYAAVMTIFAFHLTMALLFALAYRLGFVKRIFGFTLAQIGWDLLFNTALVYITGGIDSVFQFLYWLTIINGAALLFRQGAFVAAALSGLLYGTLVNLMYVGWIPALFEAPSDFGLWQERKVMASIVLNTIAFLLVAWGSSHVSVRLRKAETMLAEKSIDLEDLEALMRRIVQSLTNGLATLDAQGRVGYWNRAAEEITGMALQGVRGRFLTDIFPDAREHLEGAAPEGGGRTGPWSWEMEVRRADGTQRVLGCSIADLAPMGEGDAGRLVILQDLTEYRKMQDQVKRADRLAAVGELAARMAHEIRNPLTSVSGSIEVLQRDLSLGDRQRRLMDIVVRETERLNQLLSDFLLFARPAAPNLEEIDLGALIKDSTELFSKSLEGADVRIEIEEGGPVSVSGDSRQISQMLWNLMKNAAEASSGIITVALRRDTAENAAVIEVIDQGPGIPRDVQDKMFQPFFTTKSRGSGLGLAVVRRIVEDHGGAVSVESAPGSGTCFKVRLAAAPSGRV